MNTKEFIKNFCIPTKASLEELYDTDCIVLAFYDAERTGCDLSIMINPVKGGYKDCIHFPNSEEFADVNCLSVLNVNYAKFNILEYYTLNEEGKLLISLKDYETRR